MNRVEEAMVANEAVVEPEEDIPHEEDQKVVEARLLHTLSIFPQIAPSMVQIAMNPLKAGAWRPTLERLINQGLIQRFHFSAISVAGRSITYTIIRAVHPHEVLDNIAKQAHAQAQTVAHDTPSTLDQLKDELTALNPPQA